MTTDAKLTATIDRLERDYPHLSETKVPLGMTWYWLLALGSSSSALADTAFSAPSDLPKKIRLRDGLVLIRNLLRTATEEELLRKALDVPRAPADLEAINAPDLMAALDLVTSLSMRENKVITTDLSFDEKRAEIAISVHPVFGSFRGFSELVVGILLYRIIRSFLEFSGEPKTKLAPFLFKTTELDKKRPKMIRDLIGAKLVLSKDLASLTFPAEFLAFPNPNHDPKMWVSLTRRLRAEERSEKSSFGIGAVREEIFHVIRERSEPPRLPELARSFTMSDRTFLRRLASEQVTLRGLVTEARHELAKEMLCDRRIKIKHISNKLGYSEPSSFVRSFCREHGVSPTRWRAENS